MNQSNIFKKLWDHYSTENPSAGKIHEMFTSKGETVVNDHVAFRTFNDPRTGIDILSRPFIDAGYESMGEYRFDAKKLRAKHFELPGDPEAPRVFISELLLEEFSDQLRDIVGQMLDEVPEAVFRSPRLIFHGSLLQPPKYSIYNLLREESEYAAWLYVFGFRANHFTVSINHLVNFKGIREVNNYLKSSGFPMNSSGGEVKGSREQLLEQSSILADQVEVTFEEGVFRVPSCYYEFAMRYEDEQGKLFSGFIAGSADKIFESTNYR